jgi:hypothetical protein
MGGAVMRSLTGLLAFVWMLALVWLLFGTPNAEYPQSPVPCGSDAECHARNPGLCADDEPYCFPALPASFGEGR